MCGRVGRRNALNRADTSRRMMRFLATRLIYLVGASIVVLTLKAVDASEKFSSEIAETNQTTMASLGIHYYPTVRTLEERTTSPGTRSLNKCEGSCTHDSHCRSGLKCLDKFPIRDPGMLGK